MRNKLFLIITVMSIITAGAGVNAERNSQYNTEMVKVGIRDTEIEAPQAGFMLEPGSYFISGASQLRITDFLGDVTLFKGRLAESDMPAAKLSSGGMLE